MDLKLISPATVTELAAASSQTSTLYFGVGTGDNNSLLNCLAAQLEASELMVIIEDGSKCFEELQGPERTPAIGAWSSIGVLIDYAYDAEGIHQLMQEARRFVV